MVEIMNFSMFLPEKAGAAVALCTIPGELLPVQITQKLTHKPQTVNGRWKYLLDKEFNLDFLEMVHIIYFIN